MISSITSAFSYYLTSSKNTPTNLPPSVPLQTNDDWVEVVSSTPSKLINWAELKKSHLSLKEKIERLREEKICHITYGTGRKISNKKLRALDQTSSSTQRKIIENQKNSSL